MFRLSETCIRCLFGFTLACSALAASPVHATNFATLYAFKGGNDGASPETTLIKDHAGNLYGTTSEGGSDSFGTVFTLAPDGAETVLYSFKNQQDGANPCGPLLMDRQGNLYGTTTFGGSRLNGTVFKLTPNGVLHTLHAFAGLRDGAGPESGVIRDESGHIFGMTPDGGGTERGTIFELNSNRADIMIHEFGKEGDGAYPYGGLIADTSGNLYGTTSQGGADFWCTGGCGTVFRINPTGTEAVLHTFAGETDDGFEPVAPLIQDGSGNLYGTTLGGGTFGNGTVFKLGSGGKESVLYSFGGISGDGEAPSSGLVRDRSGNLYGTTLSDTGTGCGGFGCGTVFKVAPGGAETILHAFSGGNDGGILFEALLKDGDTLYGSASTGGKFGAGTIFKVKM